MRADASDPAFARDPPHWIQLVCRRAMERWRPEARVRSAAAAGTGIPRSALDAVPPLMLALPVGGMPANGARPTTRMPLLLAEARRAGFESYVLGPVTPANQRDIPARVLEAEPGAPGKAR